MKTDRQNPPALARFVALILLSTLNPQLATCAQGTAFTYQGRLTESGVPANGSNDFTFTLYNTASGGATVGVSHEASNLAVTNGLFTVTLDYGAVFDGNARWLQIAVRPASVGAYTHLVPRQPLSATPYAMRALSAATAGSVAAGGVNNLALASDVVDGAKILNGSIASADLDASLLNGTFWKLGGNANAAPGANFLGTTDTNALEFKVDNQRGLRLEPTTNPDTVNVIGGSARNSAGAGTVGATIGGGGAGDYFGVAYPNHVAANFSTVSGGYQNTIQTNAPWATIGGGQANTIQSDASRATIGGGDNNTIQTSAREATISGGYGNAIQFNSSSATIGGGSFNKIQTTASDATIGGGALNMIQPDAYGATIGGGAGNTVQPNAAYATIPGGQQNSATNYAFAAGNRAKANHTGAFVWADNTLADFASTANNQFLIRASGGVGINKTNPAATLDVNGGVRARGGPPGPFGVNNNGYAFSGNGGDDDGGMFSSANGQVEFYGNSIERMRITEAGNVGIGTTAPASALHVNGTVTAMRFIGGSQNSADGTFATVGGGSQNNVSGAGATVGGGRQNISSGSTATAGGGNNNIASGTSATVPGGDHNLAAGDYSLAAGTRAKADHTGAFVWADATGTDIASTAANSVTMRASGGYRLFSNSGATAGLSLAAAGTAWAVISDRNVKKDFAPVDQRTILEKLAALPITQWRYQWESRDVTPHLGPMAQDFKAAFFPGTDDKTITTQEADGVALAAIQGLNEKLEVRSQKSEVSIQQLQAENAELKRRLEKLERLMSRETGGAQ